jgi:hypothetical protein
MRGYCNGFCLRRSTLTGRGTPLASLEAWRVASPTPRLNTKAGFINSMSYLPKYYFQDIPAAVMEEIIQAMERTLPEPSWEEIDQWLNCHNEAATIPAWYERAEEFTSIHRY